MLWLMQQRLAARALDLVCLKIMMQNRKHKRHDLKEEELQRASDKWNEDQKKQFDFISKRLREKLRQGPTSTMSMTSFVNAMDYLQKQ